MTLQGRAKVRRVGNSLCVPLPMREARADGIRVGDEVEYIILRPRRIPAAAFGSARKYLKNVSLQKAMDEDRGAAEA